ALAFSPDGSRLGYVRSDRFACIWDLPTGREIQRLERQHAPKDWKQGWKGICQFLNRDEFLIATHEAIITVSVDSGKEKSSIPAPSRLLGMSPDGRPYVRWDKGTIVGDTRSRKEAPPLDYYDVRHDGIENGVAFSPDGKALAIVNGSREIVVLRVA